MVKNNIINTDKPHSVFSLEADTDYIIARLVNFCGSAFASKAGYYSQQALEKYLKAFSVQEGKEYLKTHDLIELANHCSKYEKTYSNKEFIEKLQLFNIFIEVGRYGGAAKFDPLSKKTVEMETAGVFVWNDTNIQILDSLVFDIRGKLDFAKIGFSDSINAVVKNDANNYLVGTWKLPINLKDILITGNNYFK